ncbi:amidohydrolase family protein [Candidatus Woesearchaeota archaeon]|nr:amidohydrolase family protein [Candidatus Woesearchaeota archaeon]
MKKRQLLLFLTIFAIAIYGCAQQPKMTEEPLAEEPKVVKDVPVAAEEIEEAAETKEEPIIKEEPTIAEPEPVVEKKEEFQIFDPVLTYEGAYNGPLYGTSEQVGSASMDSYFENLDRNGINFFIGMFGISGEPAVDTLISDQGLGEVIDAVQKHPYRVIPFFNPGIGGEEVEQHLGETLTGWYRATLAASENIAGKGFIRGFGEVETQEWSVRHNDPKVIQLIEIAKNNDINFMFHPVATKIDDVEKIIEAYPDMVFLIHMYREDLDKSMTKLIKILKEHDNLYFSMDAAHILFVDSLGGDLVYVYDSNNKQSSINKFVSTYDSKEKSMINDAIKAYKPLVDAVPDKVMWGTEIGPEYAFDPKVFDRAVKISRFVIAGFDKEDQEAVGYKNALRVFGQGVVADSNIKVIDTRSWSDCTDVQIGACDTSCEIPDSESLTSEQEACFQNCLIGKQCREVVEMDVG